MSKPLSKENVINNKKDSIKKLNNLLEEFIKSPDSLKKANLISYWLKSFVKYVKCEDSFQASKLIRYTRGSVIRLNFGFNIGKEFGGLHLAVVIDNDNKRNADVVTVVPLSSTDGKEVHERSVDLGTELYKKINAMQEALISDAEQELAEFIVLNNAFNSTLELLKNLKPTDEIDDKDIEEKIEAALLYKKELDEKEASLKKNLEVLKRNGREIAKLKIGSMAVTNQITTVSKQRIYTPKRSEDFLYGISLSTTAMEKINDKLKELYIHS